MSLDRPNVLVLLTDQQRADTIEREACRTPTLEHLAERGTQFSRCYSPNPVCSPARASLMTGELPHDHGVTHVTHTVPDHQCRFQDLPTWGERLHAAGYDTGYIGKWHVEQDNDPGEYGFETNLGYATDRFDADFEEYLDSNGYRKPPETGWSTDTSQGEDTADIHRPAGGTIDRRGFDLSYTVQSDGYNDFTIYGTHDRGPEGYRDYYAYQRAEEFVRERTHSDRPWCLTVSTFGPHDPFVVPREYYERYDPETIEKPPNFEDPMADKPALYRQMRAVWDDLDWEHVAEMTACYYAFCTMLDERMGRLIEALERTDQREETVVIFTSDHGDLLGAHRLFLKGAPAFEEAYRVPLVIHDPRHGEGSTRDEVVQSLDLAPTIADVAGVEFPSCFGDSLAPFLRGDRPTDHENEAYAEYFGQRFYRTHRVVWDERYKYVFNGDGEDELYDLETDPHERDNIAENPSYQDVRKRMASRMWTVADDTGDATLANAHYPTLRTGVVGPSAADPDSDAEE